MADQVPAEVSGFQEVPEGTLGADEAKNKHTGDLFRIEIADKKQKLWSRPIIGILLSALLAWQNWQVFGFLYITYRDGRLEQLAPVFSVLCTATLIETAAIVHTMVKWIFSEMEYKYGKQ